MNEDRGSRYHRLRRRAVLAGTAAGVVWLLALLTAGPGAWVSATPIGRAISIGSYVLVAALGYEALLFPFALYRNFVLERRYGLSSESFRAWLRDHLKAAGLGLCLMLAGAATIEASIAITRVWWWAISAGIFVIAGVLVAVAAPVVLLPLFYRFNPLDRESLHERLLALTQRAGVSVLGAFEWGLGAKTTRANALLVGLGRTRRILVSDTLLRGYTDDEIEVILAHEIAHHVHRDVWAGLLFEGVVVATGFCAAQVIAQRWGHALGVPELTDLRMLPLAALVLGSTSLAAAPLRNAWSRHTERRADRFALRLTRHPAAFISAMRRLGAQNLADERPSPATFWFFHTHPTIDERIETAKRFRAA